MGQNPADFTISQIREAYCRIRKIDQTIPDDILDLMKVAAIEKLRSEVSIEKVGHNEVKKEAEEYREWITSISSTRTDDDLEDAFKAGAEWANEQKGEEVDLTSPYDLSECSEDEKAEILKAAANACMPVMLHAFISAGIENYTEHQIVNTSDGKRYVLTFQTEASFMKRVNLSAVPEKYSKKYQTTNQ